MPKSEERGFSYKKRSKDSLKERANMKGGNFDTYIKPKFKQWKPKDGKNLIRILPPTWKAEDAPWQQTEHYGLDIYLNFNIGADNQAYLSRSKHLMEGDPIAEARREANAEGEKEFAKKLNPNQRILYWIIDRNDEDEGPLLWAAPFTFDKSLSNLCIDEDTKDVIFIDDPEKGRDVRFYKEGTGLTTKYDPSKMKVLPASTIHEDEGIEEDWLAFIADNPLPTVLNFYSYDHIKGSFDGQIGKFDDDEEPVSRKKPEADKPSRRVVDPDADDEPAPRARTRTREPEDEPPAKRRVAKPEVDDDDEPAPPRRARKPDPEDDEPPVRQRSRAPDPEEGEDEEAPPPRSRRGKTEPEDEDEGGRRGSLREKLAARRQRPASDDD